MSNIITNLKEINDMGKYIKDTFGADEFFVDDFHFFEVDILRRGDCGLPSRAVSVRDDTLYRTALAVAHLDQLTAGVHDHSAAIDARLLGSARDGELSVEHRTCGKIDIACPAGRHYSAEFLAQVVVARAEIVGLRGAVVTVVVGIQLAGDGGGVVVDAVAEQMKHIARAGVVDNDGQVLVCFADFQ